MKKLDYKDKFGNLVETVTDPGGLNLTDSMKYDVMGNLTESYSPMGYATTYSYNTLGQLTQKTSPDAGTTQYLYDQNGNLRLVKDADRTGTTNNTYPFSGSLYGTSSHNESLPMTMPGNVDIELDNYYGSYEDDTLFVTIESSNGTPIESAYCTLDEGYNELYIPYLPKGTYVCAFRSTADPNDQGAEFDYDAMCNSNDEFTYKKYDAMNRLTEEDLYYGNSAGGDFTQANANNVSFPSGVNGGDYGIEIFRRNYFYDTPSPDPNAYGQRNVKGRLSYTESYDVNANLIIRTSYSYDEMGRVEWMVGSGLSSYPRQIFYTYDLQGNVTSKYDNNDNAPGMNGLSGYFGWQYSYDNAGRLNNVVSDNGWEGGMNEADYSYFASGKPKQMVQGPDFFNLPINYHYNQRDWLISDSSTDFWEHIGYAQNGDLDAPLYNGDVSWTTYYMNGLTFTNPISHNTSNDVGYGYSYDNANRLTAGDFIDDEGQWGMPGGAYTMDPISYDKNGNLQGLVRMDGNAQEIDNLSCNYRPGTDIDTLITNSDGTGSAYTYDDNGNMTSDTKNNIGFIIYDIYNEPVSVYRTDEESAIQYKYDPNGNRVEKEVGGTYNYYYRDKDGNADIIAYDASSNHDVFNTFANGDKIGQIVWDNTSSNLSHYFYLKDHVGDVKMILDDYGTPQVWNDYYPFGETMPGRSQFNAGPDTRYQYVGVEHDVETGLYATGPRLYDPWRGGFDQPDRFDFFSPDVSPYSYGYDNPISNEDASGDTVVTIDGHSYWEIDPAVEIWGTHNTGSVTLSEDGSAIGAFGISGHRTEYVYQEGKQIWSGGTWAWRNNNPGNITSLGKFALRYGAIGSSKGFAVFPSYLIGDKALLALIKGVYGQGSVSDMMYRYAPPANNPTERYVKFIVSHTGIDRGTILNSLSPEQIRSLANAIEHFEGYRVGTITSVK